MEHGKSRSLRGSPGSAAADSRHRQPKFSARGEALVGQEMFKVLDKARRLEEEGIRVYHLELGNPRLPPPMEIVDCTVASLMNHEVGYTSSAGHPDLRRALASRYSALAGRSVVEDCVTISPANFLISQFLDLTCDKGDRVALFTPAFPSYFAATSYIGLEVVDISLAGNDGFDLTRDDVDAALAARPKAILVNSANNPTGAVYDRDVLEYLAGRCHQKGVWLLSDETYGEMCYGSSYFSLSRLEHPRLVVISSFSKIFSIPGFRIGYAVSSKEVAQKLALSNSTLISCLPIFTQLGCVSGLKVIDNYMADIRAHFESIARECSTLINQSGILRCAMPQAGFYIFLDIGATGLDDMEFSNRLLEERHTAVTPGRSFGERYRSSIRIAVCGKRDDVLCGASGILSFASSLIRG